MFSGRRLCFSSQVVRIVQLEHLFSHTKDLPVEAVENLLGALLSSRDPAAPRRRSSGTSSSHALTAGSGDRNNRRGSGAGAGESSKGEIGVAMANFEAHAVLALELSSRVVLANRHRISRLWLSLHDFLARYANFVLLFVQFRSILLSNVATASLYTYP